MFSSSAIPYVRLDFCTFLYYRNSMFSVTCNSMNLSLIFLDMCFDPFLGVFFDGVRCFLNNHLYFLSKGYNIITIVY